MYLSPEANLDNDTRETGVPNRPPVSDGAVLTASAAIIRYAWHRRSGYPGPSTCSSLPIIEVVRERTHIARDVKLIMPAFQPVSHHDAGHYRWPALGAYDGGLK